MGVPVGDNDMATMPKLCFDVEKNVFTHLQKFHNKKTDKSPIKC